MSNNTRVYQIIVAPFFDQRVETNDPLAIFSAIPFFDWAEKTLDISQVYASIEEDPRTSKLSPDEKEHEAYLKLSRLQAKVAQAFFDIGERYECIDQFTYFSRSSGLDLEIRRLAEECSPELHKRFSEGIPFDFKVEAIQASFPADFDSPLKNLNIYGWTFFTPEEMDELLHAYDKIKQFEQLIYSDTWEEIKFALQSSECDVFLFVDDL